MEKKSNKEILFIGLALFATYFGAGNLIFPPILGLQSGQNWIPSAVGLALSGIFLPVIAMVVIGMCGSVTGITKHVSKNTYNIVIGAIMFIVLFVANPRTAATAIEMGIKGTFPNVPYIPLVIIYFVIVFFIAKNKGQALDRIGKFLTPAMVVILFVLIVHAFVSPIGEPIATELPNPFMNAFLGGYNTGDVLVSFLLASVFLGTIESKGFLGKERNKVTIIAAVIAFVGLFFVYTGLMYMGACGSGMYPQEIGRAELLVELTKRVGGRFAMGALGLATVLACLTTAVGQATAAADYFVTLSKGKFNYTATMAVTCIISMLMALIGVDKIVAFSNPIYSTIYPIVLVLLLLGVFSKVIPNDGGYKGAVLLTLIYSVLATASSIGVKVGIVDAIVYIMPFAEEGMGWILPAIIGFIVGSVIYPAIKKKEA